MPLWPDLYFDKAGEHVGLSVFAIAGQGNVSLRVLRFSR